MTFAEERHMCPVCIAGTAAMIAGAGSAGGLLAVCIVKFERVFKSSKSVSDRKDTIARSKKIDEGEKAKSI